MALNCRHNGGIASKFPIKDTLISCHPNKVYSSSKSKMNNLVVNKASSMIFLDPFDKTKESTHALCDI